MAQQPKIEVDPADVPRVGAEPQSPSAWRADRPGDFAGPADVPTGPGFGTPGPDTGYALKLLAARELELDGDEDPGRVHRAAVHLISARASHYGRAPTAHDGDVALALLGLNSSLTGTVGTALSIDRKKWVAKAANAAKYGRALVASVDEEMLISPVGDIVAQLQDGVRPLQS